jgi:hypothetical protein
MVKISFSQVAQIGLSVLFRRILDFALAIDEVEAVRIIQGETSFEDYQAFQTVLGTLLDCYNPMPADFIRPARKRRNGIELPSELPDYAFPLLAGLAQLDDPRVKELVCGVFALPESARKEYYFLCYCVERHIQICSGLFIATPEMLARDPMVFHRSFPEFVFTVEFVRQAGLLSSDESEEIALQRFVARYRFVCERFDAGKIKLHNDLLGSKYVIEVKQPGSFQVIKLERWNKKIWHCADEIAAELLSRDIVGNFDQYDLLYDDSKRDQVQQVINSVSVRQMLLAEQFLATLPEVCGLQARIISVDLSEISLYKLSAFRGDEQVDGSFCLHSLDSDKIIEFLESGRDSDDEESYE